MKRARSIRLQPKLLLGLVAMAAVLAAILAPSIAQLYRARMEEQYASLAFGQASVAADLIDGDRVEQYYRTGEKDAYYEEIHRYLLFAIFFPFFYGQIIFTVFNLLFEAEILAISNTIQHFYKLIRRLDNT